MRSHLLDILLFVLSFAPLLGMAWADGMSFSEGIPKTFSDSLTNPTDSYSQVLGLRLDLSDNGLNLADAIRTNFIAVSDDNSANWADSYSQVEGQNEIFAESINSLADAFTQRLEQREILADNAANLADAYAAQLSIALTLSDSINNLADASSIVLGQNVALSEARIAMVDYATACVYLLGIEIECVDSNAVIGLEFYDSFALSDSIAIIEGQRLTTSDSANNLAEDYSQIEGLLEPASDSFTLTDALAKVEGYVTSQADSINNLADSSQKILEHQEIFSDNVLNLADSYQQIEGEREDISDSFTLADSFGLTLGGASNLQEAVSDSFSLTDAIALNEEHRAVFADSENNLADAHVEVLSLLEVAADSFSLSDASAQRLGYELPLNDSQTQSDAIAIGQGFAFSDANALTDSVQTVEGGRVVFADSLNQSDQVSLALGTLITVADDVSSWNDATQLIEELRLTFFDSTNLWQDEIGFTGFVFSFADSLTLQDSIAMSRFSPPQFFHPVSIAVVDPKAVAIVGPPTINYTSVDGQVNEAVAPFQNRRS